LEGAVVNEVILPRLEAFDLRAREALEAALAPKADEAYPKVRKRRATQRAGRRRGRMQANFCLRTLGIGVAGSR
jgi:hypothetical protein